MRTYTPRPPQPVINRPGAPLPAVPGIDNNFS
jgi:hypothetical protein